MSTYLSLRAVCKSEVLSWTRRTLHIILFQIIPSSTRMASRPQTKKVLSVMEILDQLEDDEADIDMEDVTGMVVCLQPPNPKGDAQVIIIIIITKKTH